MRVYADDYIIMSSKYYSLLVPVIYVYGLSHVTVNSEQYNILLYRISLWSWNNNDHHTKLYMDALITINNCNF